MFERLHVVRKYVLKNAHTISFLFMPVWLYAFGHNVLASFNPICKPYLLFWVGAQWNNL